MSQGWLTQGIASSHSSGQCTPAIKIETNVCDGKNQCCGQKLENKAIDIIMLLMSGRKFCRCLGVWFKVVCGVWFNRWWVKRGAPAPLLNPRMRLPKASQAVKRAAVGTFQLSGIESQFGNFLPASTPINSGGGMLTVHRAGAAPPFYGIIRAFTFPNPPKTPPKSCN